MGHHFYVSAWKSVKHKSANMDVLIVLGTTYAWLYGVILIFYGYPTELYHYRSDAMKRRYGMMIHMNVHNFEMSAVLIVIVTLGKFIESFSKMKTIGKLSELASLKVQKANLVLEQEFANLNLNCKVKEVQVELLYLDDYVIVYPGGAIPTDGSIVFGHGFCNEAMLTGESKP